MPQFQPIQVIQMYTPTIAFTSKLKDTIYSAYYNTQLKTTICKNHSLYPETFDRIDWITHAQAFLSLTWYSKITISKHYGILHWRNININQWNLQHAHYACTPMKHQSTYLLIPPQQQQPTAKPALRPSFINFTHMKPHWPSLMPGTARALLSTGSCNPTGCPKKKMPQWNGSTQPTIMCKHPSLPWSNSNWLSKLPLRSSH